MKKLTQHLQRAWQEFRDPWKGIRGRTRRQPVLFQMPATQNPNHSPRPKTRPLADCLRQHGYTWGETITIVDTFTAATTIPQRRRKKPSLWREILNAPLPKPPCVTITLQKELSGMLPNGRSKLSEILLAKGFQPGQKLIAIPGKFWEATDKQQAATNAAAHTALLWEGNPPRLQSPHRLLQPSRLGKRKEDRAHPRWGDHGNELRCPHHAHRQNLNAGLV